MPVARPDKLAVPIPPARLPSSPVSQPNAVHDLIQFVSLFYPLIFPPLYPKVRTGHGTRLYIVTCLFNLYAEYIMQNARLDEAQAGIKISGRNINNLRYADETTLIAKSEEELKSLLMRVKEESEKAGLKFNIQKMKITASGPITSWQIEGEKVETMTDFLFLGSKITVDSDCSQEIRRGLLLGKKAMINLDSVLKSKNITMPTKVHIVKSMVFPGVTYGCES